MLLRCDDGPPGAARPSMPSLLESSGDIEVFCYPSGKVATRTSVPYFDAVTIGDRMSLVFTPTGDLNPPYALKILSPTNTVIIDNILRDLPTGMPQSPPPVEFVVSVKGRYRIQIREMKGSGKGEANLTVT